MDQEKLNKEGFQPINLYGKNTVLRISIKYQLLV